MQTISHFVRNPEDISDYDLSAGACLILVADVAVKDRELAERKIMAPFMGRFFRRRKLLEVVDVVEFLKAPAQLQERNSVTYDDAVKAAQYACEGIKFLDEYVCPIVNKL